MFFFQQLLLDWTKFLKTVMVRKNIYSIKISWISVNLIDRNCKGDPQDAI